MSANLPRQRQPSDYRGRMEDAPAVPEQVPASRRLAAALGRPAPPEPTPEQIAEFEAIQDRTDEEIVRFYGLADRTVA